MHNSIIKTYENSGIFERAAAMVTRVITAKRPLERDELVVVERSLRENGKAVDGYLAAFENGALTADLCGERLRALREAIGALEAHHEELEQTLNRVAPVPPSEGEIRSALNQVKNALEGPVTPTLKSFLATIVRRIMINKGRIVTPVLTLFEGDGPHVALEGDGTSDFRVIDEADDTEVRTETDSVEAIGLEPTTSCLQSKCSSQLSYAP